MARRRAHVRQHVQSKRFDYQNRDQGWPGREECGELPGLRAFWDATGKIYGQSVNSL